MFKLDRRDVEILRILSREARISKAELARRINLSPSPAWARFKRLERAGLISGYRAEISARALAPHVVVFVTVELEKHARESFSAFENLVNDWDEVTACWALGGGFDYLLCITTRDIDAYQRLIDQLLERGPRLARYYTYVVTKPVKDRGSAPPAHLFLSVADDPAEDAAD